MTIAENNQDTAAGVIDGEAPEPQSGEDKRRGVIRAARFVAVFVVTVFVLLLGYRYGAGTAANRAYLDTVGKHTSVVLGVLGHSCKIDAKQPSGPLVMFVAEPPLQMKLDEARKALEAEKGASPERIRTLEQDVADLEAAVAAQREIPVKDRPRDGAYFAFTIVSECGAIEIAVIFLAALLAFPAPWTKRLIGFVLGVPLLYAVNIFRLVCLGFIGAYTRGGEWFDFAHHFVWQGIYLVFVVALWMVWVEFIVRKGKA